MHDKLERKQNKLEKSLVDQDDMTECVRLYREAVANSTLDTIKCKSYSGGDEKYIVLSTKLMQKIYRHIHVYSKTS